MTNSKRAIILLSGGLDSTTTLATAVSEGYIPSALSVNYGQKNQLELEAAKKIAANYHVREHKIVNFDLRIFGGSSLTSETPIERNRSRNQIGVGVPSTYVPVRNTILLSIALAWAEVQNIADIFVGVNAVDWSGYPDCRPEFIEAFSKMANLATKMSTNGGTKIQIHTPLINLNKVDIIRRGLALGVDYSLTSTCYDPIGGLACGTCDSCTLRRLAFNELGTPDPIPYR